MTRFDRLARRWDLNPRRVKAAKITTSKIKELVDVEGREILDYGSGTGLIAFNLCEEAAHVTAMDNSPQMLRQLSQKMKEAKIDSITPVLHDIRYQPLPKNRYDLIVTAMTLHHIDDPALFVQKGVAALKKGGCLAISDLESEDGTFHTMGNDDVKHFGFEKSEIEKLYRKFGLKIRFVDTILSIRKHRDFPVFLAIGCVE